MSQAVRQHRFEPDEYLAMERASETRHEFFDGEIFALAGVSRSHNRTASNLVVALSNRLAGRDCDVYSNDLRVLVEATGLFTYPDVVVTCGGEVFADGERDTLTNPLVLIEILSPSTEAYDRGKKFEHYQRIPSIREFVLVSQDQKRVEIFRRLNAGEWSYRVFEPGTTDDDDGEIPLAAIDATIRFDEIYRRV